MLLFLVITASAQVPASGSGFWSNMRYGGGIGLGFGTDSFTAQVAPSALYQASDYFGIGLGTSFNYARFGDARLTAYGASVIGLFNPIPALQLSAEFEELRVNRDFGENLPPSRENYWLPSLYTGLGYSNGPVTFGIRYDLLYKRDKSIYSDPWMPFVRFYF